MTKVDIDALSFSYGDKSVLRNISLILDKGGIISIIGPNGVGKSTLLHCLNNLIHPSSGKIILDGTDVTEIKLKELAKVMGYVPYSSSGNFPLTVIDFTVLGRHPYSRIGSSRSDVKAAHEILCRLGIDDLAFRQFSELSAGQKQKVMIARGLVQDPKILLLDEPTANLDVKHQMEVSILLKELADSRSLSVIMVSHDLNIAAKYSDYMVMMYEGTIFAKGVPSEVITKENLETVYGVDSDIIYREGRPYVLLNRPV